MSYELYPKKYKTTQGDTWESISMDFYGTPYMIAELISCNRQYANTLMFDGDVALSIPILDSLFYKEEAKTLAPWKRGR